MYFNNNGFNNRNSITWVQGYDSAKAYQLYPNSNVLLMDSENENIFYIKQCDNVGMCSIRTFKYEEISPKPEAQYVTKDELQRILEELQNAKQSMPTIKQPDRPSFLPASKPTTDSI